MIDCTHRCARLHVQCTLSIARDAAPATHWHWIVTMPDGHFFSVSKGRMTFEQALADLNSNGVDALQRAEYVWREYHPADAAQSQVRKVAQGLDDSGRLTPDPPLAGRWHHGKGFLCCGSFRVAREDWEAGVCAAPGMRTEVFDWMCERMNASPSTGAVVPEGWKLVPVEPSEAQLVAARDWSEKKYGQPVGNDGASGCYKAMLAAAPEVHRA